MNERVRFIESEAAIFVEGWEATENEIRHRVKDPGGFDKCRRGTITEGVDAVYCHTRGGDDKAWQVQALRFDKEKFDMSSAKAWVEKHADMMKEAVLNEADPACEPLEVNGVEIVESVDIAPSAGGNVWQIAVLAFGKSKRPPHYVYTREAAQASLGVFDGAPVYANTIADDFGHKATGQKVVRDKVGMITNPVVTDTELQATLHVLPSAKWLKENLAYAETRKLPMPYQLSIDARGNARHADVAGERLPIVESFNRVDLDVVERGAAGGKFLRMVASNNSTNSQGGIMKEKLIAVLRESHAAYLAAKALDLDKMSDDDLVAALKEAVAWKPAPATPSPDVEATLKALKEAASNTAAELAAIKKEKAGLMLAAKITESKLPVPLAELVREMFATREFTEADVDAVIKSVREKSAKFIETPGAEHGLGIKAGMQEIDKIKAGLTGFFMLDPNRPNPEKDDLKALNEELKGVPRFRSIKEAYVALTGDVEVTGRVDRATRLTESLQTTDWADIMAATMNRRMVRDYGMLNLDTWRQFTDIVPVSNFKQQERVRFGGYANLPTVAQGAAYLPLTSPTDEKATYTPAKRGGTEDVTREMIINDDVASISKIPGRMARAAAQTLHEFVYEFLNPATNPNIYTGTALYLAGQLNIGSAALASDGVALGAARLRMKKQLQGDNSKRLGIRARYLLVPPDLESVAYGLVTPAAGVYNTVPTFLQRLAIVPIVVDYWTDTTDWALAADRADVVGLEVGFINGNETPEMFVADIPNVGAMFTNDKITYKIRHEYGGAVTDFRAFDGSIVA